MSNLDRAPTLTRCGGLAGVAAGPLREVFAGKQVLLGGDTLVRRLLPNLGRRLVGAWCFVDHYGPDDVATEPGMQVPPHPHIGPQTVSWLLEGTVHHRDSPDSDQVIVPGGLGLMTAGAGIAHAEQSPVPHPSLRHGVPSPVTLPLEPDFEHAVLVTSGSIEVDGVALDPGAMLYLGCGRHDLRLRSDAGARALLLGGEPFAEQIVMWWNFVGRTNDDILTAREQWTNGDRFGDVTGYGGYRLPAPPAPAGRLRPGGAVR